MANQLIQRSGVRGDLLSIRQWVATSANAYIWPEAACL